MQHSKELFQRYLEELKSLETFRLRYLATNPRAPLDREDPDVRRIIEALAYFNASNKHWVRNNQLVTTRRIFAQYFPYLLDSLPATAMLQAKATGRFVESAVVPKGTQVVVDAGRDSEAMFYTLWDLRLLPFKLNQVEMVPKPGLGYRLMLRFRTPYPRNDDIETVSLYINQLNDFYSSLRVQQALRKHQQGCAIAFGDMVTSQTEGIPCDLSFGSPIGAAGDAEDRFLHPVERIRSFFHFPEKDLFVNVAVPVSEAQWTSFTIMIDLDEKWPADVAFTEDTFQLGAVPIVNLKRAVAEPFLCDGTQTRFPILYPDPGDDFELHSVHSVYELNEGPTPVRPAVLAAGGSAFEVEYRDEGTRSRNSWILLKMPESFAEPKQVVVDAYWHQPWLSERTGDRLDVRLYDRTLNGLRWELTSKIAPMRPNGFRDNVEALLQILAIRMKQQLTLEELKLVLQSLGTIEFSHFRAMTKLIESCEIDKLPEGRDSISGLRLRYRLRLREFGEAEVPLVEAFFAELERLLDCWIPDTTVELRAEFRHLTGTDLDASGSLFFQRG